MPPSIKIHVHWMNLKKKPNHTKISKSWNFGGKGCKVKDSFFKPFDKKLCSMGSKCLALSVIHMCKKYSCQKNMFGCPLKLILRFSGIFCIFGYKPKYSYTIMYECENSPPSHELS